MRPLEIALASLIVLDVLALVLTTFQRFCLPLLILSAAALLLHLLLEGFRLQAAPIYLAFVVLLIVSWWPSGSLRATAALLAAAGACFGLLICYVYPVIAFPKPAGPLAIGTHIFYFTDTSRTEQYATAKRPAKKNCRAGLVSSCVQNRPAFGVPGYEDFDLAVLASSICENSFLRRRAVF